MARKLPYIPDKKLYAAVMGACQWIRKDGYFHKACNYYADKYDVDVEDIEKYVRIAQSNGQKQSTKKRKYHWYAIEYCVANGLNPYFEPLNAQYTVKKATSEENAWKAIWEAHFNYGNGSEISYSEAFEGDCIECESEEEAKEKAKEMKTKRHKELHIDD